MESLRNVKNDFYLLIAGKEETFKKEFIESKIISYKDNVKILLHFLSDDEVNLCLIASDFIVLPYKKYFDGASGPLGEGVAMEKIIIRPNHGSLGDIIRNNHLGYTFQSENTESLTKILDLALTESFHFDNAYYDYQNALNPDRFKKEYNKIFQLL